MPFPYFMSSVIDDEKRDLWLVTYSDGVWRYDGHKLHHYPIEEHGENVLLHSSYNMARGRPDPKPGQRSLSPPSLVQLLSQARV